MNTPAFSRHFKRTYIEITNVCNLRCSFCPGSSRPAAFMTEDSFDKILSNIHGFSKHIYLHVLGEPLLHPSLLTMLDIAENHSMVVNVTTNGVLLAKVTDALLSKPAVRQVTVSANSFAPDESLMSMRDYADGIVRLCMSKKHEQFASIRVWNPKSKGDSDSVSVLLKTLESKLDVPFSVLEKLKAETSVSVGNNIFVNSKEPFEWPDVNAADESSDGFCLGLRAQIAILVDGTVTACCLDKNGDIALGNILRTPLVDIVECDRAQNIIGGFSQRKCVEPLCRKCTYRKRFDSEE